MAAFVLAGDLSLARCCPQVEKTVFYFVILLFFLLTNLNHMKTTLSLLLAFFLIGLTTNATGQSLDLHRYSIQIAAFSKVIEDDALPQTLKQFDDLRDLGYVYESSFQGPSSIVPSKFYLGSYIGMATAKRILKQVKRKGYKDAFIVKELDSTDPNETEIYTCVQLGAYDRLVMHHYQKLSEAVGPGYVAVIWAKDKSYKVIIPCFEKDAVPDALLDAKKHQFTPWQRDVRALTKAK